MQISVITVFNLFVFLLILDMFSHFLLIQSNGTYIISACPKVMPSEIPSIFRDSYYMIYIPKLWC